MYLNAKKNGVMTRITDVSHPHWEAVRIISLDKIKEIIDEVGGSLPDSRCLEEAISMVNNLFPDSHGFSKRYVLAALRITAEARKEWFEIE